MTKLQILDSDQSLIGKRFNRLVVIQFLERKEYGKNRKLFKRVLCQCDCGKVCEITVTSLKKKHSKSCGCLKMDRCKEKRKPYGQVPIHRVMLAYKSNAKRKGVVFNLTDEQFKQLILSKCSYCGDLPENLQKNGCISTDYIRYNGIDRIDNNLGYEINNCIPCCHFCNFSKRNNTQEFFFQKIKKIYNNLFKNESK